MTHSPTTELSELCLPPQLAACDDLPLLAESGGASFEAVLQSWASALGRDPIPRALDTVAERVEAVLDLVGEAQAQRILAGRAMPASAADTGAVARQRGALAACCAALRVPRHDSEAATQTVARLRAAAEANAAAASAGSASSAAAAPPTAPTVPPAASAIAPEAGTSTPSATAPLLAGPPLGPDELATASRVADALAADYATRRSILLSRLDVLLAAFEQSSRVTEQIPEMRKAAQALKARLPPAAHFTPADAFAADASLLELQRAVPLATGAAVQRVLIGSVPDRGGRTASDGGDAHAAMRRETYVQQERMREGTKGPKGAKGGGGGGGGGSGKGGKGGRGRGGGGGGGGGESGGGGVLTSERTVTIEPSSGGCGDGRPHKGGGGGGRGRSR